MRQVSFCFGRPLSPFSWPCPLLSPWGEHKSNCQMNHCNILSGVCVEVLIMGQMIKKNSWLLLHVNLDQRSLRFTVGLREGVRKLWLTGQIQPSLCFVIKVLLEHSHVHVFTCRLWLLSHYNNRDRSTTETVRPTKPKIFITWSFTEKEKTNP